MHASRNRRFLLKSALAGAAVGPFGLFAQSSLRESARIVVGYPAGGPFDVVARVLAERLSGRMARTVHVENRTGAAGRLAVETVKSSPADGSTMLLTPGSVVTMYPHIYKNLSYDVFTDLTPVAIVAVTGFAFAIGPAVPASVHDISEFIAWCRSNPSAAQCANAGAGSFPHFMAMLLARDAKLALGHIPYRGGILAMQAAAAGQVASAVGSEASALPLEQAGKLRVLATTGKERSAFLPQTATFHEQGYPNLAQREWFATFMPPRTPDEVWRSVGESLRLALLETAVREVWQKLALSPESSTPAELRRALRVEYDFWEPVIRASGFTPES
jgi:tripartite-type tricarboxylate transporter receptor subunit TctC